MVDKADTLLATPTAGASAVGGEMKDRVDADVNCHDNVLPNIVNVNEMVTEVFPVHLPPDDNRYGQALCGSTRLFSVFNTHANVVDRPDDSVAIASEGQRTPSKCSSRVIPNKRFRAGVG